MNEYDPRENPLVERAFRSGFRRGAGSFRLGWYIAGLATATIGPFAPMLFLPVWRVEDASGWMLPLLLALLVLVFVIGGFQRMLSSFSQERERGTFDFLHLSTLRSGAIVFGFLMAGQLPGYLALVIISPLLVVAALFSEFPLPVLAALLASLASFVLALSVLFLFAGFWAKRIVEFRGASFVYAILLCFGGWAIAEGIVNAGLLPAGVPQALLGAPVILELYEHGATPGSPGIPPISFFGAELAPWLFALVITLPAAGILFFALARALRHRDRAPWSLGHATSLFGWGAIALVGVWAGTEIPLRMRAIVLAASAWLGIRTLVGRSTPTRTRTVHALGRCGGRMRELLAGEEGPPLRLGVALIAVWWGACLLLAAEPVFRRGAPLALPPSGPVLLWLLSPALFLLPLATLGLLGQWLAWRAPSMGWLGLFASAAVILLPFIAFTSGPVLVREFGLPATALAAFGSLSPFSQLLALSRDGSLGEFAGSAALFGQLPYALALALLAGLIRSAGAGLAERSRRLLAGLGPTPPAAGGEASPAPAERAG